MAKVRAEWESGRTFILYKGICALAFHGAAEVWLASKHNENHLIMTTKNPGTKGDPVSGTGVASSHLSRGSGR